MNSRRHTVITTNTKFDKFGVNAIAICQCGKLTRATSDNHMRAVQKTLIQMQEHFAQMSVC